MIKRFGIQQKLICLFLLSFIPLTMLCIWQQIQYYGLMRQNVGEYVMQLVDKISHDIERGIKELDLVLVDLLYDPDVSAFLADPQNGDAARRIGEELTDVRAQLRVKTSADCNVVLLSNDRKVLASTYNEWTGSNRTLGTQWLDAINRANGGRVIISAYSVRRENGTVSKVVGLARLVRDGEDRQGILLLEIPMGYFYTFFSNIDLGEQSHLLLADSQHYVLYSTNSQQIGSLFMMEDEHNDAGGVVERQEGFMYTTELGDSDIGVQTIAVISRRQMESRINEVFYGTVVGVMLLGAMLLLFLLWQARLFCRPILQIERAMHDLESGDFQVRVPQTARDEVGNLQRGFNHMAQQLGDYVEREYAALVRDQAAQLKDLIRMIDPHFMYNTLEAISMTAYLNDDRQVVEMLDHLADMYRFSSNQGARTTLRQAVKMVEDYFYLVDVRYDGKLHLHEDIDRTLLDCECLRFTLQPLVENCVAHGFRERQEGDIWLTLRRAGEETVEVLVRDNGAGFTEDGLTELRRVLADDDISIDDYPRMALKNIHDRLRLMYGPGNGVYVDRAPLGGAIVRLRFPRIEKKEGVYDDGDIGR